MRFRISLKENNRGASLLAVLIAMIFVVTIGILITNLTITNIRMKEVEQGGKKNFYQAETVQDELAVGLNDVASSAMQNAYTDILSQYRDIMVDGSDIQAKFAKLYMDELLDAFWIGNDSSADYTGVDENGVLYTDKMYKNDPHTSEAIYVVGHYSPTLVSDCFTTDEYKTCMKTSLDDATFTLDYEEGIFTLTNVTLSYTDDQGYNSTIKTDMVFHTPVLNFNGSNIVKDYMKYSLIANDKVDVNASNVTIDGNVYAGTGGICSSFNATGSKLIGSKIVTRGDILLESNTDLTVGNGNSYIWAENVETRKAGSTSALPGDTYTSLLTLDGYIYISDDLTLNDVNSRIVLKGNYYGYNFQKDYTSQQETKDSSYSSAMIINAKHSQLDMSGLDYLYLAGRTFISRGSAGNTQNQNDIMLGESVSVRTSQLAYYVPERYLQVTENVDGTRSAEFTESGLTDFSGYAGIPEGQDVLQYLNSSKPVTTYYYIDNNSNAYRYYLNFKSEQAANDFYAICFSANGNSVQSNAITYAGENAIIIDDNMLYTLKGDIMYVDKDNVAAGYQEKAITINSADWAKGSTDGESNGIYLDFSDRLAVSYKSLQLYLEDAHSGVTSSNIRFLNSSGEVDKNQDTEENPQLISSLLDMAALKNDLGTQAGKTKESLTTISETQKQAVVLIDNAGGSAYHIPYAYTQGIIIATGDVVVQQNFTGMILAGGTISFLNGATVEADELMVSRMFSDDLALESPIFAVYFKDYNTLSDSVIGLVNIDDYLTYDNWSRHEEAD